MCIFTIVVIEPNSLAQEKNALSEEKQKELIKAVCEKLEKLYPFPEVAEKTSQLIYRNFKDGKYSKFVSPGEFVQHLNLDLEALSNDEHLGLFYNPQMAAEIKERESKGVDDSYAASAVEAEQWNNFGFKELKILEGNIGYMDLHVFFAVKYAGETAIAAMNFFSNCNALIIDIRKNSGGWDDMVTFLSSYFFDTDDAIIFNISHSTLDSTYYSSMTSSYVPGKLLADIPLYILTSKSTASAAEAFANIMKNLKGNATLIGERTAGAENPVEHLVICDNYILRIPCWKKIYSNINAGWEGVGVAPDIEVASEKALNVAHMEALKKLKEETTNEKIKDKYQWAIDGVRAINNPLYVNDSILQSYVGKYGNRNIYFENKKLCYQYKKRSKRIMFAITEEYFLVEGYDFFRVKFIKEKDTVVGFDEIYTDGDVVKNYKE